MRRRRPSRALLDHDLVRIRLPVGAVAVAIDLGRVAAARVEEVEPRLRACARSRRSRLPRYQSSLSRSLRAIVDVVADLAVQHARVRPVGRHVLDELERRRDTSRSSPAGPPPSAAGCRARRRARAAWRSSTGSAARRGPSRLSTPGVKSIGPASMRVKTRFASCSGGFGGLPQALYSMPRAPSRAIQFGYVRRRPVSLIGSCASTAMWRFAASVTTLQVVARHELAVVPLVADLAVARRSAGCRRRRRRSRSSRCRCRAAGTDRAQRRAAARSARRCRRSRGGRSGARPCVFAYAATASRSKSGVRLGEVEIARRSRTSRRPSRGSSLRPARRESRSPRRSRCSASRSPWSRRASARTPRSTCRDASPTRCRRTCPA